MNTKSTFILIAFSLANAFICLIGPAHAQEEVTFFTDFSTWESQVVNLQEFLTNANNITESDEIGLPPGQNGDLGSILTFDAINTGLSRSFRVQSVNVIPPMVRGLVFNDAGEGGLAGPRNISVGDINGIGDPNTRHLYENDDFDVQVLSGPALTAFGFFLIGNQENLGERLIVEFDGLVIGELNSIPFGGSSSNVRFLGFISNSPVDRILFDEGDGEDDIGGDDIAFRDFFFAEAVMDVSDVVIPDSFLVTRGSYVSGGVVELAESDNADLSIQRAAADVQSRTEFEVISISPVASPSSMEVTLEGAVFARSQVNQSIELFDYVAGAWEQVDTRAATRFTDSTVTVAATGDLSRFVEAGTMSIEARIRYQSANARQQFSSNTDQFIWTISQ